MRVWVVWENGVWKSTFIKTILGQIPLLEWYQSLGKASEILYYSQMHEELYKDLTMRENFQKHGINYPDEHIIGLIKHYLFEKEDLDKQVSQLSGGQTSKLLFCILGQKSSNLLILDEPTNHLDYDTRESLEFSLKKYEGTILFISHDRYFVNKLASHVWFIQEWELSISYGNYEDYRFKLEHKLDMDMHLFDEEAQLNLVLEEKLWEKEFKRLKNKFGKNFFGKKFLDDQLKVNLGFSKVLNRGFVGVIDYGNVNASLESNGSRQNIQLRLAYNFGSKFGKSKTDRNATEEEERIQDEN